MRSVRISSTEKWSSGLILADFEKMPHGWCVWFIDQVLISFNLPTAACGLRSGPLALTGPMMVRRFLQNVAVLSDNYQGEIDIIEGVNTQTNVCLAVLLPNQTSGTRAIKL